MKAAISPYLESDVLVCLGQDPQRLCSEFSEGRESKYSNSNGVPGGKWLFEQGAQPEEGQEGGGEETQWEARRWKGEGERLMMFTMMCMGMRMIRRGMMCMMMWYDDVV